MVKIAINPTKQEYAPKVLKTNAKSMPVTQILILDHTL